MNSPQHNVPRSPPRDKAADIYSLLPIKGHDIRIMIIHPGGGNDPIKCTLRTAVLSKDSKPIYETISYTWGKPFPREPILINDRTIDAPINTVKALRCARLASQDRTVWIDFICINQNDIDERSDQVSMMSTIYRSSQRNIIYLGEDSEKAAEAFASIEALASEAEAEMRRRNLTLDEITFPNGYFAFSDVPLKHKPNMHALAWFYQRPWFGRLWVLQEAVLSPRSLAICGNRTIDFGRVQLATAWLEHKTFVVDQTEVPLLTLPGFRGANNMWLLQKDIPRVTFYHPFAALIGFSPFGDAMDMRDQVFGLIGLYQSCGGPEKLPPALQPDYRKSISDTLRDATRYAIEEERRLGILERLPLLRDNRPKGLPSWVSEWFRYHQPGDARALTNSCRACGFSAQWQQTDVQRTTDANILRIQGIAVDKINRVSEAITYKNLFHPQLLHGVLTAWQKMASLAGQPAEAVGTTALGGKWWTDVDATKEHASFWPAFVAYLRDRDSLPTEPALLSASASALEQGVGGFYAQFRNACHARSFFTTTSGRIGIGPTNMRADDTLAILQGGRLPFVLRKDDRQYELLGPAYVYGIMFGEAVDEHQKSGKSAEIFDIK